MSGYFVGIGAAKCGTTWVSDYLRRHPSVFMPAHKEMHVFDALFGPKAGQRSGPQIRLLRAAMEKGNDRQVRDRALCWAMLEDITLYKDFFERYRKARPVYGEITPAYSSIGQSGFEAIHSLFPEAKLIFSMRNPVDRLWSDVKHQVHLSNSFRREEPRDPLTVMAQHLERRSAFLSRGDYAATLEAAETVFPRERIFLLCSEDLFGPEGHAVVRSLTDFLELKPRKPNLRRVINKATDHTDLPESLRHKAVVALEPVYRWADERLGDRMPSRWRAEMGVLSTGDVGTQTLAPVEAG